MKKKLSALREKYAGRWDALVKWARENFTLLCIILFAAVLTFTSGFMFGVRNRGNTIIIDRLPEVDIEEYTRESREREAEMEARSLPPEPTDEKININTADLLELTRIPGVGETIARRIIAYREVNGDFEVIEELMLIKGIGEKKFDNMKDYVTV